jgi:HD-like signal output (HDOD) protein
METLVEKQKILFVDDEPNILLGLKRLLHSHRHEWDMDFVNSGDEALEKLKTESYQIIVSDLRMPGTTGVMLLDKVKDQYPDIIRFILSGHGDADMIIQSVGVAHQFMAKPCDADIFQEAITRALKLRELFKSDMLLHIVKDGTSLPTLPELFQELTEALRSPNSTADKIAAIIVQDMSISAKVLQLVNSAFFGLSRQIDSISQAVGLLGAETINNIVLVTQVFDKFDESQVTEFGIREIYSHSLAVGSSASKLMKAVTHDRKKADEAMLAGMVHDLGKLVLINSNNEKWKQLYRSHGHSGKPFYEQEREMLGVSHAEVGAYLIGLWGLSNKVLEAVAYHTRPSEAPCTDHFDSLTALYLANIFELQRNASERDHEHIELDMEYLESIGVADRIEEFREICSIEND